MRIFIAILALSAVPALAQSDRNIRDKASCMKALSHATWMTTDLDDLMTGLQLRFGQIPDEAMAADLIEAHLEIARQREIIADTLLKVCASYD